MPLNSLVRILRFVPVCLPQPSDSRGFSCGLLPLDASNPPSGVSVPRACAVVRLERIWLAHRGSSPMRWGIGGPYVDSGEPEDDAPPAEGNVEKIARTLSVLD